MDTAIVIAALILNPIARRKRAARTPEVAEVQIVTVLTNGAGGSNSPERFDLELGDRPIVST